jgi:hypothetical protein
MLTAIVLTVIAVLFRLASPVLHIWNFVPMGAVALYSGARLPKRWAWLVPVAAYILSDIALDYGTHRPIFDLTRWTVYGTIGATALLGLFAKRGTSGIWRLPFLSLSGSTLFFLTTNLSTWAQGTATYPMTMAGLVACYIAGIPFYVRSILADLAGTGLLFGLGPAVERAYHRLARSRSVHHTAGVDISESSQTA